MFIVFSVFPRLLFFYFQNLYMKRKNMWKRRKNLTLSVEKESLPMNVVKVSQTWFEREGESCYVSWLVGWLFESSFLWLEPKPKQVTFRIKTNKLTFFCPIFPSSRERRERKKKSHWVKLIMRKSTTGFWQKRSKFKSTYKYEERTTPSQSTHTEN